MARTALSTAAAILFKAAQEAERTVGNSITVLARVVSPPVPLNDIDVSRIYGLDKKTVAPDESGRTKSIFVFRAYIADSDWEQNPHRFIPDPCEMSQSDAAALPSIYRIINLCTKVTSEHSYAGKMPTVGDWINIRLNKIRQPGANGGSWDTANGDFVGMALEKIPDANAQETSCNSLQGLFLGPHTPLASTSGARGPKGGRFINNNSESTPVFDSIIPSDLLTDWPLSGEIVSGFTYYRKFRRSDGTWSESPHPGIDIAALVGTEIYSPLPDGVVKEVVNKCPGTEGRNCGGGFGNHVVVQHQVSGRDIYTSYSHLSEVSVVVDGIVGVTTKIGEVGMTGQTGGPHLHFEVYDGTPTRRHRISPGSPHGDPDKMSHIDPMQALNLSTDTPTSSHVTRTPTA